VTPTQHRWRKHVLVASSQLALRYAVSWCQAGTASSGR
jgi:hypothetical protein